MGEIRRVRERGPSPLISIVVPSLDGDRDGNVARLLGDLGRQTEQDFEVVLAVNFRPNGLCRNEGVRAARGRYLVCIDDDVRLGHDRLLEHLLQPFSEYPNIGMTGPAQQIPDDSTPFQRRVAAQVARCACPIVTELTDSDFVTHMCLCIPAQLYKDVGWENEKLVRGTDGDLRLRVREAGYRVVVVPDCWAYHPVPETWRALLRMAWRNGAGSAWVRRHYPNLCIETPPVHKGSFAPRRPLAYRAARFAFRFLWEALRLRHVAIGVDLAYACGYAYASLTGKDGLR